MEQKAEPVAFILTHPTLGIPELHFEQQLGEAYIGWTEVPLYATPQPAAVDGVVKLAFLYAYAAGFKTCEETSRSCIGSVDEAWEEYQALAQIERKPEDGK